jgi:methionyl-tRNA formyltransferase
MRIVFCGTPDFAVPALRALFATPHFSIEAVVTQPDRPRGRGQRVSGSPVKIVAAEEGAHIYQPERLKSPEALDFFTEIKPDAVVIIAYGQIVPRSLLDIPRLGWMNLHASLLPKYRGAAPIAWAIINGETKTGLTTMRLDPGLDTGPILLQRQLEIGKDETAPELAARMAELGASLVIESLTRWERGEIAPIPQNSTQASYAPILTKDHGHIDWTQTSAEIYNRIRGLAPWPGAFSSFRGRLCHIWGRPSTEPVDHQMSSQNPGAASEPGTVIVAGSVVDVTCGGGTRLRVEAIQIEGRKRITAREFLNGARPFTGERFGG